MNTAEWCENSGNPQPPRDATKPQSTVRVSYLCEHGWQPLLITGFLRDFLHRQWCDPQNIVSPEMKQYVWRDSVTSGILIESVHRYKPESIESRPAIMIKRNAFRQFPIGISNQMMGAGITAYPNEKGAIHRFSTLFVGSHTLFCIHKTGASAEILASEVLEQAVTATFPIRLHLGLRQFSVTEVGAIQPIANEAYENMIVPITIGWAYEFTWQLREESLALQDISLTDLLGDSSRVGLGTIYQGI